tara:strand:- start:112 stop:552 length:441 start_codon:yes stop_codon:yes gene_type:complete
MKIVFIFVYFIFILYSCSPINKQHGYLIEDMLTSIEEVADFNVGTTTKNDILLTLGSPSVKIDDINNVWIYLVSVKEKKVFENDDIIFQSITRFEFDDDGILLSKDFLGREDYTEVAFTNDKTKVLTDDYGIADQIYETFTRTSAQ